MAKLTTKTDEEIICLEFSPFQASSSLLAVAKKNILTVKACSLQESTLEQGKPLLQALALDHVANIQVQEEVRHVSWSPASLSAEGDTRLHFCTAGSDHKLRVYSSDLLHTTSQVLEGHRRYVNDIACHPTDPTILASVGEDRVCQLWDMETGQPTVRIRLGSPGTSVRWHHDDHLKLLVAEKGGCIRFYDVTTATPVMSLQSPSPPLLSADWAPSNSLRVGGVANGCWCLWDISTSSQPLEVKTAHHEAATEFRWCHQSDQVFATVGNGNQVKVYHTGHQKVPIQCDLPVVGGVSWHARLPVLAATSDRSFHLWSVET